ncbi:MULTISPECIES: DUF4097 family beta strand repeat-containing protein [Kitasatospora]|uniref:DUF4097 domain-containing protein n=1 Tax=Kitasatospora setae (strain ATCC 33774 / DSM 43861 / JCM 3304 / KCC A-0304 / NBRC 14216 / KM-6054) TaxID=452652 RepID=E4N3T8_KITSK|nr:MULTISPECIES: DUF4097 family beta strand repeat-containing protein [Kitasatospora]BAJ31569.1 hypothetical protein KSE_57980 [Kitasatospora setae KM-6054]
MTGLAVLAAGTVLAGCNPANEFNRTPFSQNGQADATGATLLRIDSHDASVTLSAGDGPTVQVSASGTYAGQAPQVTTTRSGDTATVSASCPDDCQLQVTLPASLRVKVEGGNGAIAADGLAGALDLHTSDGSITLRNPTGPVTLKSNNGQVSLTGAASKHTDITTADGAVTAAFGTAPNDVRVTTKDGAVDLSVPPGTGYRIDTRSSSSSPQIDLPSNSGAAASLTVATSNGGIHIH